MVLEVTKPGTCFSNDTVKVLISPQPDAAFTVDQEDDCEEVVFELQAARVGLPDYQWTFSPTPNTVLSDDDTQLLIYTRELNSGADIPVTISLTTQNLANCESEEVTQTFTVLKKDQDVVSDFTISADTIQLPDSTISIQNNSTPGAIYSWDFGDGRTSTAVQPGTHSFRRHGAYEIDLVVMNGFCSNMSTRRVVVLPADPILDFEADILEGCSPLTVKFTNRSQFTESGKYIWEFGDGSISKQDNPTYTYYENGRFSVRLRG